MSASRGTSKGWGGSPHNQTQLELTRGTVARANQTQNARAVPAYHHFTLGKRWWTFIFPKKLFIWIIALSRTDSFCCCCTHKTRETTHFRLFSTHAAPFGEYRKDICQTKTAVCSLARASAGTDALEGWLSVDVFLKLGAK